MNIFTFCIHLGNSSFCVFSDFSLISFSDFSARSLKLKVPSRPFHAYTGCFLQSSFHQTIIFCLVTLVANKYYISSSMLTIQIPERTHYKHSFSIPRTTFSLVISPHSFQLQSNTPHFHLFSYYTHFSIIFSICFYKCC